MHETSCDMKLSAMVKKGT